MNENAKKWVAALRSGEYKQATRALHKRQNGEDFFCCLGVACDLAVKEGIIDPPEYIEQHGVYEYGMNVGVLPRPVGDWLGLSGPSGNITPLVAEEEYEALTILNDRGASFGEIADLIESEPGILFR